MVQNFFNFSKKYRPILLCHQKQRKFELSNFTAGMADSFWELSKRREALFLNLLHQYLNPPRNPGLGINWLK
jgi:hypothetical protein